MKATKILSYLRSLIRLENVEKSEERSRDEKRYGINPLDNDQRYKTLWETINFLKEKYGGRSDPGNLLGQCAESYGRDLSRKFEDRSLTEQEYNLISESGSVRDTTNNIAKVCWFK